MKSNIFREYDIRGIVNNELIVSEVYDLGKAILTHLHGRYPDITRVIIGRDGRTHSSDIHTELVRAAINLGFDVIDIDVVPTPTLYFAVKTLPEAHGLQITASHNPKEYNGIKIWGAWGAHIQDIRQIFESKKFLTPLKDSCGRVIQHDALTEYIAYLVDHFSDLKNKTINAVIDCGNAPGGLVFPRLVKAMGWKNVQLLFTELDGTFPNHEADPTVAENMTFVQQALTDNSSLQVGIGLDGDCDRMSPMTKSGVLVAGDKLLALFAQDVLQQSPHAAIVCDIKSSSSLFELLTTWKATYHLSPSGHSLIKEAMITHEALLAGELSCHFFFKDRYFGYDDGIYAGCRLLDILDKTQKSLESLLSIFPHKESSPEIRIGCRNEEEKGIIVNAVRKIFVDRKDAEIISIDGIRAEMSYGWGLVRASNTQPVVSLRFESNSPEGLIRVKNDFYDILVPFFNPAELKEKIGI